jgi:hypothetical protein
MALYRVGSTESGNEIKQFTKDAHRAFSSLQLLVARMTACGDDLEKFEAVFGVPQADVVAFRTLFTTLLATQSLTQNLTAVLTQVV